MSLYYPTWRSSSNILLTPKVELLWKCERGLSEWSSFQWTTQSSLRTSLHDQRSLVPDGRLDSLEPPSMREWCQLGSLLWSQGLLSKRHWNTFLNSVSGDPFDTMPRIGCFRHSTICRQTLIKQCVVIYPLYRPSNP